MTDGAPKKKAKVRPLVRGYAGDEPNATPGWASPLAELEPPPGDTLSASWKIQDKTHLEFTIDYPIALGSYTWESYFFVPDSLRLRQMTYDKKQIYDDLLSYVRMQAPKMSLGLLAISFSMGQSGPFEALTLALDAAVGETDQSAASREALRQVRKVACIFRASLRAEQSRLRKAVHTDEGAAIGALSNLVGQIGQITRAYRALLNREGLPPEVVVAVKWVDEDLSLLIEGLFATSCVDLSSPEHVAHPWHAEIASRLAHQAVEEARYRKERGYPSVGSETASPRDVEHIEFRRHVLKRFTASVYWLHHEVRDGATWVLHMLYALAAAVAMAFAAFATIRAAEMQGYLTFYFVLLVVSYAVKDRMKAILQTAFARWAEKRFADRAWTIRDESRQGAIGLVAERAGFRGFSKLPADVLAARRVTREHALEEFARPETVVWHEKTVTFGEAAVGDSKVMTEIFRLNVGSWLLHTDDPNRSVAFADPDTEVVCAAVARRVYNINVLYRLRRAKDAQSEWKRLRVVVSRKGIERIDPILT